ncbi:MAG: hypothetical protein ACRDV9_11805, partial [Acidimicrobiia bacterium]
MHTKRVLGAISLAATLTLVGAACANNDDAAQTPSAGVDSPTTTPAPPTTPATTTGKADYAAAYDDVGEAYHHMFMTGDGLASAIATQKNLGDVKTPAADLRITLDRLLGEHATLAIFAMQKGLDGSKDFEAAAGLLDKNSDALGEAIGSVYGPDAKTAFLKQWKDHIRMFVDFTVGSATKDQAKRDGALNELSQYKKSFGEFLGGATGLPPTAVGDLLQMHVNQLTGALDSYQSKDYAKAYAQAREAYAHMFDTGDGLASAIAKQKGLGEVKTKASDLRVALDRLLGEHALLAVFAMQKGADGKADFMPIAGALDKNSDDLGEAIGSVYGPEAKTAFLKQWKDHIRMFVDFTVGSATKDQAKRDGALNELSQ